MFLRAVTLANQIEQRVTAEGIGHSPRDIRIMTSRYLLKLNRRNCESIIT